LNKFREKRETKTQSASWLIRINLFAIPINSRAKVLHKEAISRNGVLFFLTIKTTTTLQEIQRQIEMM